MITVNEWLNEYKEYSKSFKLRNLTLTIYSTDDIEKDWLWFVVTKEDGSNCCLGINNVQYVGDRNFNLSDEDVDEIVCGIESIWNDMINAYNEFDNHNMGILDPKDYPIPDYSIIKDFTYGIFDPGLGENSETAAFFYSYNLEISVCIFKNISPDNIYMIINRKDTLDTCRISMCKAEYIGDVQGIYLTENEIEELMQFINNPVEYSVRLFNDNRIVWDRMISSINSEIEMIEELNFALDTKDYPIPDYRQLIRKGK